MYNYTSLLITYCRIVEEFVIEICSVICSTAVFTCVDNNNSIDILLQYYWEIKYSFICLPYIKNTF
jgi:hypothetical protein